MESMKKYHNLLEKEALLKTEKDSKQQDDEKVKEKLVSIDEQEKTILDLKNQIIQIRRVKRTRNLFCTLGIIVIVILSNILLYLHYDKVLIREIDKYQTEIDYKESTMEEQLQQMQVYDVDME